MRILIILISLSVFLCPTESFGEEIQNLGFVQSSIWYDKEPFFAGEPVRIYTILANSTEYDFGGMVAFYVGEDKISSTSVTLSRYGGSQVVFADWTPSFGTYSITARIENAQISKPGETPRAITLSQTVSAPSQKFVDLDTDKDKVGNQKDSDDDGDKIPDTQDPAPLVADSPVKKSALTSPASATHEAVQEILDRVSEYIPGVVSVAQTVFGALEKVRVAESQSIEQAREKASEDVAESAAQDSETASLLSGRSKLAALSIAGFVFDHKVVFYFVFGIIGWFVLSHLIPFFWRKWRGV